AVRLPYEPDGMSPVSHEKVAPGAMGAATAAGAAVSARAAAAARASSILIRLFVIPMSRFPSARSALGGRPPARVRRRLSHVRGWEESTPSARSRTAPERFGCGPARTLLRRAPGVQSL